MFYTTTTVFSFMNAASYWLVTLPHNPDATISDGPCKCAPNPNIPC